MRSILNKKLLFIILLGLTLRLVGISNNPPALYGDELTLVYDSYSLLKTGGYDSTGQFLPLTFSMGAGRPAGYVYLTIPFVYLFGPTALGVRGLSVLSGIGLIICLYLLGKKLHSERLGLVASLLGAISPWDVSLSRGGFESHLALFLVTLATLLIIESVKKGWILVLAAFLLGVSIHTYPTYKLTLLFLIPLLFWYGVKNNLITKSFKYLSVSVIILGIFGLVSLQQLFYFNSEERFFNINIFSKNDIKQALIQKVNNERSHDNLNALKNIYHNQPLEYASLLTESYINNFSADFLLFHGDKNPRHNMANMGEIYMVEIVSIFMGLFYLWSSKRKEFFFILGWLLIGPIATSVLGETHALRSALMLPALILLSSFGFVYLKEISKGYKNILLMIVILGGMWQFSIWIDRTYFLAPNLYGKFWSLPAKQASEEAIIKKDKFDNIILSKSIDNIEYAYPVYGKIDPNKTHLQKDNSLLPGKSFKVFGNVYIGDVSVSDEEKLKNLKESLLYIKSDTEGNLITITK